MDAPIVLQVAGLAALYLVLQTVIILVKYLHGKKDQAAAAPTHERQLLKMIAEIGNMLRRALYILQRWERWMDSKKRK